MLSKQTLALAHIKTIFDTSRYALAATKFRDATHIGNVYGASLEGSSHAYSFLLRNPFCEWYITGMGQSHIERNGAVEEIAEFLKTSEISQDALLKKTLINP